MHHHESPKANDHILKWEYLSLDAIYDQLQAFGLTAAKDISTPIERMVQATISVVAVDGWVVA